MSSDGSPQPRDNAGVRNMFGAAAASYDQVISFFGPFGRGLVAAADVRPGNRVLDVASGRGACFWPALEAVGPDGSVLGVDLTPEMVAALAADVAASGVTNAEVRVGDAEHLDLPSGWFDVVLGGFMIFFPAQPQLVLSEFHRVLRPGGRLALSIFDGPAGFPFQGDLIRVMEKTGVRSATNSPLNRADVLDAALGAASFGDIDAIDVVERFRFADVDEVLRWQWSTGTRSVLEQLDDAGMAMYVDLLTERLQDHKVEGGYQLIQRARVTVATKR